MDGLRLVRSIVWFFVDFFHVCSLPNCSVFSFFLTKCHTDVPRQMEISCSRPQEAEESETNREYASSDDSAIDSNRSANTSEPSYSSNNNSEDWRSTSEPKTLQEAVADLERAVAVMLFEYNIARKAILYGLDEHGRPLVEGHRLSSTTAEAASVGEGGAVSVENDRFGEGKDDGVGGDAGVKIRVAPNDR